MSGKNKTVVNGLNSVAPSGTQFERDRKDDAYKALVGEEQNDTTDRWGKGRKVSIEREGERTLRLQRELDDLVEAENVFQEDEEFVSRKGQPPCKRVRKEG